MILSTLLALLLAVPAGLHARNDDVPPVPPPPPSSGPGSAEYAHAEVATTIHGKGVDEFWLFEPRAPRPADAPVVVFLHGWGATYPRMYGAWIDHLVRRGQVVVFPRYQLLVTPMEEFTPHATRAVRRAFTVLEEEGHVHPRRDQVAFLGHSMGGVLAANLAAVAAAEELPAPRAIFCVAPGITASERHDGFIALADLARIPRGTLLLSMYGDADEVTGARDAERIYRESTAVPPEDKDLLVLHSDDHGRPRLRAEHNVTVGVDSRYGRGEKYTTDPDEVATWGVNSLDWYGLWKPFDALCDAAFHGRHRDVALGNTPAQRYMGKWSDGTPVRELEVLDL